jgi:hypothetical protein
MKKNVKYGSDGILCPSPLVTIMDDLLAHPEMKEVDFHDVMRIAVTHYKEQHVDDRDRHTLLSLLGKEMNRRSTAKRQAEAARRRKEQLLAVAQLEIPWK